MFIPTFAQQVMQQVLPMWNMKKDFRSESIDDIAQSQFRNQLSEPPNAQNYDPHDFASGMIQYDIPQSPPECTFPPGNDFIPSSNQHPSHDMHPPSNPLDRNEIDEAIDRFQFPQSPIGPHETENEIDGFHSPPEEYGRAEPFDAFHSPATPQHESAINGAIYDAATTIPENAGSWFAEEIANPMEQTHQELQAYQLSSEETMNPVFLEERLYDVEGWRLALNDSYQPFNFGPLRYRP